MHKKRAERSSSSTASIESADSMNNQMNIGIHAQEAGNQKIRERPKIKCGKYQIGLKNIEEGIG